jgi:hypothetical protein
MEAQTLSCTQHAAQVCHKPPALQWAATGHGSSTCMQLWQHNARFIAAEKASHSQRQACKKLSAVHTLNDWSVRAYAMLVLAHNERAVPQWL